MIGLANRVRLPTERSPVPLDPFSVTMHGLHQLQPLVKRFWPSNVFMSRPSVNTCTTSATTNSLHAYDRKEGSGLMSRDSIPKSGTRRGAPISAAASRQTLPSHSGSNEKVGCGRLWVSGRVRSRLECFRRAIFHLPRHPTSHSGRSGPPEA